MLHSLQRWRNWGGRVGGGGHALLLNLTEQLTLAEPGGGGGADYAQHITTRLDIFSNIPALPTAHWLQIPVHISSY